MMEECTYFDGRRIAQRDSASGGVFYYFQDALGSTHSLTNAAGTVCYDADFYPFGGELDFVNNCTRQTYQQQRFAGMEYDPPMGYNSYTQNRIYGQNLGRWYSPDPLGGGRDQSADVEHVLLCHESSDDVRRPAGAVSARAGELPSARLHKHELRAPVLRRGAVHGRV
jgi:RHS repeat-associated protein